MELEHAAAEVIAAFREHEAMLLVGGHTSDRVKSTVDTLEITLRKNRMASNDKQI